MAIAPIWKQILQLVHNSTLNALKVDVISSVLEDLFDDLLALSIDKTGSFEVYASTPISGAAIDGNDFDVSSRTGVSVQITGTWTGTLFIWGSVDGTTFKKWKTLTDIETGTAFAGTTANTIATGDIKGLKKMRVIGTSAITGTAVITWRANR